MQSVDEILYPRWIEPVVQQPESASKECLENHGIVIDQGKIIALAPTEEIKNNYQSEHVQTLPHHLVLPGLVNAHTHAAMTLFRGFADDLPLMEWLSEHIWPAESQWVNKDFVQCGTTLAIAEMIRSGTTCFNDMYFFPDVTANCAQRYGIRACVGMIVIDFPTVWASDSDEYIAKGLAMRDALRHQPLVTACFAPHAPYTVSDKPLERIRTLADELECPIHIHLHETAQEVEESTARYGLRPLERLDQLGLLTPKLNAVHMTQLLPAEIATIADRGVNVIHCPESNLKLASGLCRTASLVNAGVNVAIGTDGASSNNDLDMIGEMRSCALLAKGVADDPTVMSAYSTIYAATMGGAKALGLEQEIGSLEPGKSADIIAIDFSEPETLPVPIIHLVSWFIAQPETK